MILIELSWFQKKTAIRKRHHSRRNFHVLLVGYVPCEQWFFQAGRYGKKGEKPLRVTVCFSIEHTRERDAYAKTSNDITSSWFEGNMKDLKIQQRDGNESVKNIRFNK